MSVKTSQIVPDVEGRPSLCLAPPVCQNLVFESLCPPRVAVWPSGASLLGGVYRRPVLTVAGRLGGVVPPPPRRVTSVVPGRSCAAAVGSIALSHRRFVSPPPPPDAPEGVSLRLRRKPFFVVIDARSRSSIESRSSRRPFSRRVV